ncbi:MAG: TrmH family RNA methyltransferase [Solirubrobacteraceae bacterium]
MTTIVSTHNPKLKALRRLQTRRGRAAEGRFVVEGEDLVTAAAVAGRAPLEGYRLEGTDIGGAEFTDVERAALASVSTLGSGTRAIAVYEQRWGSATGPLCVYLHGVGDPGNVGTVLRSAAAFGASCVVLGPNCADPHSPKAVRASMGAIFAVSLARVADVHELPGERIALDAGAQDALRGPIAEQAQDHPVTLLIGSERDGLPDDVLAASDRVASIPIATESINAAMAATVALYEMTRRGGRDNDTVPAS